MHYYRIYDDHEELNFFKSTFSDEEIAKFLKEFECQRKEYYNLDFVEYLKKKDIDAELIEIHNVSY